MSVYIFGLDKPKEKYIDIRLFNNGWAQIKTDEWPYAKGFRTIEVSQHGDLVDSSIDVNNYVTTWNCECSDCGLQCVMSVQDLGYLPVIIPADQGG